MAQHAEAISPKAISIRDAIRALYPRVTATVSDTDPAPWHSVSSVTIEMSGEADVAAFIRKRKLEARGRLFMHRALLSGALRANFDDTAERRDIPGWAWEGLEGNEQLYWEGRLVLSAFLPADWQRWSGHDVYLEGGSFAAWLDAERFDDLAGLPALPSPYDLAAKPKSVTRQPPPDVPFVTLCEAVTWIAFELSLNSNGIHRAIASNGFEINPYVALADAMAKLTLRVIGEEIAIRGKLLKNRYVDEQSVLTEPIDPIRLEDFARFDMMRDGLEYGSGLVWTGADSSLSQIFNDREDRYLGVKVNRAQLMKCFPPAHEPPKTEHGQLSWETFGLDWTDRLERSADQAALDEWWTWPEAIAWAGSRDVRNIATVRGWELWWRADDPGADRTFILKAQHDIALKYSTEPHACEPDLISKVERGDVKTSGRSSRDAKSGPVDKNTWRGGTVAYGDGTANLVSSKNLMTVWAFDIEVSRADLLEHFPAAIEPIDPENTQCRPALPLAAYPDYNGCTYDWSIWQAVEYVRNVIGDTDVHNHYPATLIAIRQAALDNHITLFGKRELSLPKSAGNHSDVWTRIMAAYWEANKLNRLSVEAEWQHHDHTWPEPETVGVSRERYWGLLVNRREIERRWPIGWSDFKTLFQHWRRMALRQFSALRDQADLEAIQANRQFEWIHIRQVMSAALQPVLDMLEVAGEMGPPSNLHVDIMIEAELIYDHLARQARKAIVGDRRVGATGLALVESEPWLAKARIHDIVVGWNSDDLGDGDIAGQPADAAAPLPPSVQSTTGGERECREWLLVGFANDPDKRRSKKYFQDEALTRFSGRLSVRGFLRAWDAVAPTAGRSVPGRKS